MSQGIQESPADSNERIEELGEEGLGVPGWSLRKGRGPKREVSTMES